MERSYGSSHPNTRSFHLPREEGKQFVIHTYSQYCRGCQTCSCGVAHQHGEWAWRVFSPLAPLGLEFIPSICTRLSEIEHVMRVDVVVVGNFPQSVWVWPLLPFVVVVCSLTEMWASGAYAWRVCDCRGLPCDSLSVLAVVHWFLMRFRLRSHHSNDQGEGSLRFFLHR